MATGLEEEKRYLPTALNERTGDNGDEWYAMRPPPSGAQKIGALSLALS